VQESTNQRSAGQATRHCDDMELSASQIATLPIPCKLTSLTSSSTASNSNNALVQHVVVDVDRRCGDDDGLDLSCTFGN